MKNILSKPVVLLLTIFFTLISSISHEAFADSKKERKEKKMQQIANAVAAGKFQFDADRIIPTGYTPQYLTGDYSMSFTPDTIKAYLPYIGSAHIAPMGSKEGESIDFTSTKFTKKVSETKRGWDINVSIDDNRQSSYRLLLSVSKTGSATLSIEGAKRQPVSFNGNLKLTE